MLRVPESIPYEKAAPLLCAGITTYSPLNHWNAGPGKKVAVVGLGGLGHMAVKIAHAMGAEVTVLSQTLSKKDDGLKMGADHYYATKDEETFEKLKKHFDLIINTVSAPLDLKQYLGLLALNGTMVNVGAPPEPLPIQVFTLFTNRRSFAGSSIGGIRETQEMLDFCAENGIAPETELISADQINEAYERVLKSDVRYRFVIDAKTFAPPDPGCSGPGFGPTATAPTLSGAPGPRHPGAPHAEPPRSPERRAAASPPPHADKRSPC